MKLATTREFDRGFLTTHKGFCALPPTVVEEMRVVAQVYPFQVNSYVVERLINWENPLEDPLFRITFPQRGMLNDEDFFKVKAALAAGHLETLQQIVAEIRASVNPHPGGQTTINVPLDRGGRPVPGIQHKFPSTVLFFPRQGQTCHSYCNFCFRWPQFVGEPSLRIEAPDAVTLSQYLRAHPEVTDVLITGGDPFVMRAAVLRKYVEALLQPDLSHLKIIRFGTKAFTYWPFRFFAEDDSAELLQVLSGALAAGKHVSLVAHFNHPNELEAAAAQQAIASVRGIGVEVRTQTPMIRGVNDQAAVLARLWQRQIELGCVPYYLYAARDTGAQRFFGVPLARSLEVYGQAVGSLTGLVHTLRGPVMSCSLGKVQIIGVSEDTGKKLFVLQVVRAHETQLVGKIFHAHYDAEAMWISELAPALGAEARWFLESHS